MRLKPIELLEHPNVKPRAISSEARNRERSTTIRKEYAQAGGSGGHGNVMIWSDLHGNMQQLERAAAGVANRREHNVKRACFKWGIGRELYTAPFIWVPADKCNIRQGRNGKPQCFDRFHVEKIEIVDGRIEKISIWNDTTNQRVFVKK